MLDYLQKFRQLPENVRNKISNSETSEIISDLEKKYGASLVSTVMRVATKDVPINELESHLINEVGVPKNRARALSEELDSKIFSFIKDYLHKEQDSSQFAFQKQREKDVFSEVASLKEKKEQKEGSSRVGSEDQTSKKDSYLRKEQEEFLPKRKKRKKLTVQEEGLKEQQEPKEKNKYSKKKKKLFKKITFLPKRKKKQQLPKGEEEKQQQEEGSVKKEVQEALAKQKRFSSKQQEKESQSQENNISQDNLINDEDEKELKQLSEKVKQISGNKKQKSDFKARAEKILRGSDINFSSQGVKDRFISIISTYLQGVRNKQKTRDALSKDFQKGGLGFDDQTCDKIFEVAEKYLSQSGEQQDTSASQVSEQPEGEKDFGREESVSSPDQNEQSKEKGPSQPDKTEDKKQEASSSQGQKEGQDTAWDQAHQRDMDYDLASALKQMDKQSESEDKGNDPKISSAGSMRSPQASPGKDGLKDKRSKEGREGSKSEQKDKKKEETKKEKTDSSQQRSSSPEKPKEKTVAPPKTKVKRTSAEPEGSKKKIEDIKKPPQLVNPVNELKYMDLIIFRRLGKDAKERTQKVQKRMDNLGKKYFTEKLDGIKAWRKSPVYSMYVQIGKDSIVYNKSVDDIIEEKNQEYDDYLNKEEFDAIMDLNNQLRFY